MWYKDVKKLCDEITLNCLGVDFTILLNYDKKYSLPRRDWLDIERTPDPKYGRLYIQLQYTAPCTKTGEAKEWKSGKRYLSSYMTKDEVVKQVYSLFRTTVEHELMEGFKYKGKIPFNPHVSVEDLITLQTETVREEHGHN